MPSFTFQGEPIAYLDQGQGPALILIPGLGGRLSFWQGIVPSLATRFRTIALDYPMSVGKSDAIKTMADVVLSLLDHLNISRCSLIGQSMGGPVVQCLALSNPERFEKIVFSSTWATPDAYFVRAFQLRSDTLEHLGVAGYAKAQILSTIAPEDIAKDPERAAAWEERTLASSDPAVLKHRLRAILDYDAASRIQDIPHPCLVLTVTGDQVVPPHMSRHLAQQLPNAELVTLSGGGHFKAMLDPDEYLAALGPFLKL